MGEQRQKNYDGDRVKTLKEVATAGQRWWTEGDGGSGQTDSGSRVVARLAVQEGAGHGHKGALALLLKALLPQSSSHFP